MRLNDPLIVGAGPAGCMAAIQLARAGARPTLIDRDAEVADALCGGFISWKTATRLRAVGIGPVDLGAHPVTTLALFAHGREIVADLPAPGYGLSRRALDRALRRRAIADGARMVIDRVRNVEPGLIEADDNAWEGTAIFLASGKHDVRGAMRPRSARDPALGMRLRIPAIERLQSLLNNRIELHLFRGGYAGIVLQDGGTANVCLAVRKSLLAAAGGSPIALLNRLAAEHRHFADRLAFAPSTLPIDSVGNVPYGWIARDTPSGLWRLGDQAAVIPSLAGEGMAIALASGAFAAEAWVAGGNAPDYQRAFAVKARRPVAVASAIWRAAERDIGARGLVTAAGAVPALVRAAMHLTRI